MVWGDKSNEVGMIRQTVLALSGLGLWIGLIGCQPSDVAAKPQAAAPAATASTVPAEKDAAAKVSPPLSPQELAEGWVMLFDGETLFGWTAESDANWTVADGVVSATQGKAGLLRTTIPFADFQLKVDFRADKTTNSGVFLRMEPNPAPDAVKDALYEVNIAPVDNPFPTGGIVQRKRPDAEFQSTDWQTFDITAEGGHIAVKINGKPACDYVDPKPVRRGYIGLQFREGPIAFRNVKLRPLSTARVFNGKDLTGWKTYPDMKSRFSVTPEGWLNVKDGRGQLETEKSYGDFTMQLEVFVNGKNLNSGVFYRCIPGELMNGYESQIHNGFKDGDRTKPLDCGTGGIFRRKEARKVMADDFAWFHDTIHVVGNRVAVWVNGYQVTDWVDERPADKNPRKGCRLEPGTIMLQGHDPTTDISFRQLRIAEVPSR